MSDEFKTYADYTTDEERKAYEQKVQSEANRKAEERWYVSRERWIRFRNSAITVIGIIAALIVIVLIGSAIHDSVAWSDERKAWQYQCEIDGGMVYFVANDLKQDGIMYCIDNGKILRTHA